MISQYRNIINEQFSEVKYAEMIQLMDKKYPSALEFRICETPIFIPQYFTKRIVNAGENIIGQLDVLTNKNVFQNAILPNYRLPGNEKYCPFLLLDFGVCKDEKGDLVPKLIELQGFPSMYFWELQERDLYRKLYDFSTDVNDLFQGMNTSDYLKLLRKIILDDCSPEEVVLMDFRPEKQKTRIDFQIAKSLLGIQIKCISQLFADENGNVYYWNHGKKKPVKRIYNRLILDEFFAKKDQLPRYLDIFQPLQIDWVAHPNWFYTYSKFCLPFLQDECVPDTKFVSELSEIPTNLSDFVLKPIDSFAGNGVKINVQLSDFHNIDPERWILQRKVDYASVVPSPSGALSKVELRMMYFKYSENEPYRLVHNLARLSKGNMSGVNHNQSSEWTGSSLAFFE